MILLLFSLLSFSAFSSSVFFADSCSREEIKIGTPNGTVLALNLSKLDPFSNVEVRIVFRPSGVLEDLKASQTRVLNFNFSSKNISADRRLTAYINIPPIKWMRQVEKQFANYHVWDAEVTWVQNNKAKSMVASFYRPPKLQSFYEIKSEVLCSWEGKARIDSKLYENNVDDIMSVSRASTHLWNEGVEGGVSFGYSNNSFENIPVGAISNNYGWVFEEWKNQFENSKTITIRRDYFLSREEAGLFVVRPTYNRHKAVKYKWVKKNRQCGAFVPVARGHIDIGKKSEDFMVIPANYYGRDNLSDFIELVRPAINTCKKYPFINALDASDIIQSGFGELLYFYELGSLK